MNEPLICIGCGATIQTNNVEERGFIPLSALEKSQSDTEIYCQRCFRLRHYNDIQDVEMSDSEFLNLLHDIGKEDALIVYVVDIFDFNGSLISGLHRFVGQNPILLVGNKVDLLPKSLKRGKLTQWLKERSHEAGLRPIDVVLTSGKKAGEMPTLLAKIESYRQGRNVYIVGVTNVGKSTLINQIIRQSAGIENVITTSRFPGTTLDKIEIPLEDGQFMIDTPGIIHPQQMAHFIAKKELSIVTPSKEIKPRVYQLKPEQTVFLGGLARFDFVQGSKTGIIFYAANDLQLHRTKLATADAFLKKHQGGLLQPPGKEEVLDFPELIRYEFSTKEKTDIVFAGLGWVTVPAGVLVAGWAPKGVEVIKRKALI